MATRGSSEVGRELTYINNNWDEIEKHFTSLDKSLPLPWQHQVYSLDKVKQRILVYELPGKDVRIK